MRDKTPAQIYRDTACFRDKQWFIDGFGWAFSTKQDAENALRVAGECKRRACDELADKIRGILP